MGGAGVARGYLDAPELTAERFIDNPFGDGRLYKTGDLVRRLPDGNIVFAGRADGQVKLRGLRIELGEIEAALVDHPAVAQAVAVVAEDRAGERQLAGYVRLEPGRPAVSMAELRAHLARRLPGYMVPAHLLEMEAFPLNNSGKIDKALLPAPDATTTETYAAPRTMVETLLADMYARLLGVEKVGIDDGFFELGGNSLQTMRLITLIDDELAPDFDLGIAAIFLAPTPRRLAALLRDEHGVIDIELDEEGATQ